MRLRGKREILLKPYFDVSTKGHGNSPVAEPMMAAGRK